MTILSLVRGAPYGLLLYSALSLGQERVNVLTHHNSNDRTGRNLQEVVLNASNVNAHTFGRLLSVPLDGNAFGQPLYVALVHTQGADRSMVYVATAHNTVYGIDAHTGAVIWHHNLGRSIPRIDVSQYSHAHMPSYVPPYYDLYPEIGITSTPVIDIPRNTIYVVAKTKTVTNNAEAYQYSLHALDLVDGTEKKNSPVTIDAHVDTSGRPVASGAGINFDAFLALNRAALLLLNNRLYVAFASQGDVEDAATRPFHGWIFGYDTTHIDQAPWVFCTSPSSQQGGIWQSGGGLAADFNNHLLAVTSNGPEGRGSYGNSVLNFKTDNGPELESWFTPDNSDFLNRWDLDFGSSGLVVVPDQDFKDLVIAGGKDGMLYVLHRSSLGHGHPTMATPVVQSIRITPEPQPIPQPPTYHGPPLYHGPNDWHHLHGTPVYWNGPQGPTLYLWPEMDKLKAFTVKDSGLTSLVESKTIAASGMPGAALSLSANGDRPGTGILWASRPLNADANRRNVEGILEAYDASHIAGAVPIWTNRQNLPRNGGGFFAKFSPPTVAEGRVFLSVFAPENPDRTPIAGKSAALVVYGLLPSVPAAAAVGESIDDGVVRFFAGDVAREAAEPSYSLQKPLAATGTVPAGFQITPHFTSDGQSTATIHVDAGTSLYGTGMVFGHLLRNGQSTTAWNMDNYGYPYYNNHATNLYQSHPWVLAVRADGSAYGVLADTTHKILIDTTTDITFSSDVTFPLIVIERASPQGVLSELAKLTGYMQMPPKWALGYHQSHFSYTPELEVLNIAAQARRARIPLDAVWMDIDYMDHYRIFSFSPRTFADTSELNHDLALLGVHNVWMIDPAVRNEATPGLSKVFDTGVAQDVWVKLADGKTVYHGSQWPMQDPDKTMRTFSLFPDFTSPRVRAWWVTQFKDFLSRGVDGVWNDMNEPAVFVDQLHTMPLTNRHVGDPTLMEYDGQAQGAMRAAGDHIRYHNVYGMLMAQSTRQGIAQAAPDRRPFVLARANFIGGQRYAAAWTGDNTANWEHLGISIPMILNLGLSGQPFAGADIGGYRYSKDEQPPLSKDDDGKLFARWLGFGALYPFSRAHFERNFGPQGTPAPGWQREPWVYAPQLVESNRRAVNRRYRLMPFLYTVCHEASTTGLPIMRPMFFADPKDPKLRAIDHEFLIGADLLVAVQVNSSGHEPPVLPSGSWPQVGFPVEDETGASDIDTPDLPVLYVRGGAIVPTGPLMQYVDEKPLSPLTLVISPAADGTAAGTLYEDAGDGYDYQKGGYRLTSYYASTTNGDLVVTSTSSGNWPPARRSVVLRVLWKGQELTGTGLEGQPIHVQLPKPTATRVREQRSLATTQSAIRSQGSGQG
jgi:alpha-glucosidase